MEVMDIAVVTELIGSFGFPIALVIAMGWFILKLYNQSVVREEKLMQEIAENRIVNDKAIETLAVYAERLGAIETDVKEIKQIITSE
jgi:sensor histidine kinase YesM